MAVAHLDFEITAHPGAVAEVSLDRAANVLLMNTANYNAYQQGQAYQYYGGHATVSPFRMVVPAPGTWHVVVDLGGGPGEVRAGVRQLVDAEEGDSDEEKLAHAADEVCSSA